MASPLVDVGTGFTIVFGTSAFTAELLEITPPPQSRESFDTSHQGTTTARTKTPGTLVDNGELLINFHFNPDTEPPIDAAAETITITFPSTATWAFSGFMTNYAPEGTFENKMVASATVVVSGDIAVTAAA
jgi:hypothetical protein